MFYLKKINRLRKIFGVLPVLIVVFCLFTLTGCKADISAYADDEIEVIGLTEKDFIVTPAELAEMECESVTAKGDTQKAGTVKGYGPTLQAFVESHGASLDDFSMVRMTARDHYKVLLGAVSWDEYDVILSIAEGSKAYDDNCAPMRIVIPGGNSGNWIRQVVKMEFIPFEED